jgi:hypothetical protein
LGSATEKLRGWARIEIEKSGFPKNATGHGSHEHNGRYSEGSFKCLRDGRKANYYSCDAGT